jgi:rsbT antagonist protein RsbS
MQEGYHRIPIIKLWHLLLVPLQGEMTDDLANDLITEVLAHIHRDGSTGLIIDITGLWIVDSHLCAVLTQLSAAASLMGTKTIICGMKPEIALTLETMDVQLGSVATTRDLEGALNRLGISKPVKPSSATAKGPPKNAVAETPPAAPARRVPLGD